MSQSVHAPKTSTLAVVALVMSILFFPVGLVLAIVALVRISSSRGALGGQAIAIVALVISLLVVPFCGGLAAAIAIPNFVKFQCRSMQSEAKANLKALLVAEESFRGENNTYSTDTAAIGFQPAGNKLRYRYVVTTATATAFGAEARGEGDVDGDVWTIDQDGKLQSVQNTCDQ
jgi:type IV pilus assembly protein PilA